MISGQEGDKVFNTCSVCGTLNYFEESIHQIYSAAKCYHCGNLVEVPDFDEELIIKSEIEKEILAIRKMESERTKKEHEQTMLEAVKRAYPHKY